ncbi:Lin1244/Lin1753 domain-containing protein [Bacteroides faecis]|uniref:Lin1244/Lin1753 domain-containing protein n=1 Tax=Bacteroides faecis TaxID=674529 RepID=UPI001D0971B1|nr:Lin1244/Lin1753 domain-containing protein [Bacteroides faecis]MCB6634220.1 DUF4373 domain-containing protein [Bacteroides faecis]
MKTKAIKLFQADHILTRFVFPPLYTGIPYFPLTSNFFEEDVPELLEAKFGIKASYLLIRLLSKIYKEGYYIT